MTTRRIGACLFSVLLGVPLGVSLVAQALQPPAAAVRPRETKIHGITLRDDYFWLREKTNPDVIKHLEAENAYTEAVMKPTAALQQALYKEMLGRIKQTDLSVPSRIGAYLYYSRTQEGKQYPYLCRRKGSMDAPEELLLDLNALAEGKKFMSLGVYAASDDGNWLAYSTDPTGYRQYTLQVKDLRTGAVSSEKIERAGSVVWARDKKTIFYTTEDPVSKRSDKFWRHVVGAAKSDLLYEEKDALFDVYAWRSLDKAMVFLMSAAKTSREVRYLPADNPSASLQVIAARQPDHEYDVDHYQDRFYITTNKDAKNFRVVSAPVADASEKNWTPYIDHKPGLKIDNVTFFADHLVVSEREGGLNYLRVVDVKTKESHRVATDEADYALFMGSNPEFTTGTLRITYQTMVTPSSV